MEILKNFSILSIDRLVEINALVTRLGKALSCWRHGQRTRFFDCGSLKTKAPFFRQGGHKLKAVINTDAPDPAVGFLFRNLILRAR